MTLGGTDPGLRAWLRTPPEPADWVMRFTVVEAVLGFEAAVIDPPLARAVEARVLAEGLLPRARRCGLPVPDTSARGEALGDADARWADELVAAIRP